MNPYKACLRIHYLFSTMFLSILLVACGGGGGSGGANVPGGGSGGGTPSLSVSNTSVTEGDSGLSNLTFTVSLSAAASGDVTVDYATSDVSATAGSDYTTSSGTLTISAGSTSGTVTVSITGDTDIESNETLTLTLSNPSGATIGTTTATGTINDDDSAIPLPVVNVADTSITEGDSGTSNLTFTVSLSASASGDVTVDYATSNGTATAGSDYTATSGTLTISAGSTSDTVTVSVAGDTNVESNETLTVTLTNPVGASLGTATATGTISNDDSTTPPPPGGSVSGLFYNSGSISMVDPDNPTAMPVLVDVANTVEETPLSDGALDIPGQRVTGLHTRTIIYVNTDDGRLYKISALMSDPQTPVQVSNETGAGGLLCDTGSAADFADHNNSVYLYKLPGADSFCGLGGDDEWKMVRVGMGPTVSPVVAKEMELELFDISTGAITGFLALENQKIVHCDQNFLNCSDVAPFVTSGEVLEDNILIGSAMLLIDNKLYHYDVATRTLSAALHTFSGTVFFVPSGTDGDNLYFASNDKLYKLPMDGSAASTLLATSANGAITSLSLTKNRVVYGTQDIAAFSSGLESVSKSGGAVATLFSGRPFAVLGFTGQVQTAGTFVYYNALTSAKDQVFGVINEDGTGGTETLNATMSGFIFKTTSTIGDSPYARIVWAEGCLQIADCSGGTLKSVKAATNSGVINLGAIPADVKGIVLGGFDGKVLGIGLRGLGEIFFADVTQAGSLQRITTTFGGEYPIN